MNIQNLNQQKKYLEKKLNENPPPSEKEDLETIVNQPNLKILYQNSETQEELYSFNEKNIEGFKEFFVLLEKGCFGHNETAVDVDASKKIEVIFIKIKK